MAFAKVRQGVALSAGTGLALTQTVVFSNSNNVSFGMQTSASSYVITASTSGGLAAAIQSLSVGLSTISAQVVLSNSNGFSFGANGQTITADRPRLSYWDNRAEFLPYAAQGSSSTINLSLQRVYLPFKLSATQAAFVMGVNLAGSTAGSFTISMAAYTFAGSTASTVSSASSAITWNSGTNSTVSSIYAGESADRWRSVGLGTWSITPGDYLFGFIISVNGVAGSTATISMYGITKTVVRAPADVTTPPYFAAGLYSAGTAAFPASIHLSAIYQTGSGQFLAQPYFQLVGTY